MKKIISLFLCTLCLIACQDDFDELIDTQQRHITFTFNTEELFANVLGNAGSDYILSFTKDLSTDYRLRISLYCYNSSDSLICGQTILSKSLTGQSVKVRHLQLHNTYSFVFVADIVKYDPYVSYYETWYQLSTEYFPFSYIYADGRDDNAEWNSMAYAELTATPENQNVDVKLTSITYNGFRVFNHIDDIDRISGYVMYTSSFYLKTKSWQKRNSIFYSFDERNPQGSCVIKPVSLCYADSIITVKLRTYGLSGADSTIIDIPNYNRRPFVATFNCATLSLDNCKFY